MLFQFIVDFKDNMVVMSDNKAIIDSLELVNDTSEHTTAVVKYTPRNIPTPPLLLAWKKKGKWKRLKSYLKALFRKNK